MLCDRDDFPQWLLPLAEKASGVFLGTFVTDLKDWRQAEALDLACDRFSIALNAILGLERDSDDCLNFGKGFRDNRQLPLISSFR